MKNKIDITFKVTKKVAIELMDKWENINLQHPPYEEFNVQIPAFSLFNEEDVYKYVYDKKGLNARGNKDLIKLFDASLIDINVKIKGRGIKLIAKHNLPMADNVVMDCEFPLAELMPLPNIIKSSYADSNVSLIVSLKLFKLVCAVIHYLQTSSPALVCKENKTILDEKIAKKKGKKKNKKTVRYLNIVRYEISSIPSEVKRAYNGTKKAWAVKGHERKYKNGKVVYIKPTVRKRKGHTEDGGVQETIIVDKI